MILVRGGLFPLTHTRKGLTKMNKTQVRKELEKHGYVYLKGLSLSENIERLATVKQGAKQGAKVSFYTD